MFNLCPTGLAGFAAGSSSHSKFGSVVFMHWGFLGMYVEITVRELNLVCFYTCMYVYVGSAAGML